MAQNRYSMNDASRQSEHATASSAGEMQPAEFGTDIGQDRLQTLDLFLEHVANLVEQAEERQPLYDFIVNRLPPLVDATCCLVLLRSESQAHVLHWGPRRVTEAAQNFAGITAAEFQEFLQQLPRENSAEQARLVKSGRFDWIAASCPASSLRNESSELSLVLVIQQAESAELNMLSELLGELLRMCRQFEAAHLVRQHQSRVDSLQSLTEMMANLSSASSYREMAYSLVNDLSHFSQADRVSYFELNGQPVACSGIAEASRNSRIVKGLGRIAQRVGRTGINVAVYPGGQAMTGTPSDERIYCLAGRT